MAWYGKPAIRWIISHLENCFLWVAGASISFLMVASAFGEPGPCCLFNCPTKVLVYYHVKGGIFILKVKASSLRAIDTPWLNKQSGDFRSPCLLILGDYEITAGSCMSVKLLALRSGFTTLTVTYQYNDIILKAAITVGSYHALKVSTNKELDCAKDVLTENCFDCFLIKYNPKVSSTNSSFPLFLL